MEDVKQEVQEEAAKAEETVATISHARYHILLDELEKKLGEVVQDAEKEFGSICSRLRAAIIKQVRP